MISDFPSYQSHKIVRAAPILEIEALPGTSDNPLAEREAPRQYSVFVKVLAFDRSEITVDAKVFARGLAQPGDYLVVYDDGYLSWSPKAAFEGGYTRADP